MKKKRSNIKNARKIDKLLKYKTKKELILVIILALNMHIFWINKEREMKKGLKHRL